MAKKKQTAKKDELSFEQSIESLRVILTDLESGNLSLSESLEKYEQGVGHLKRCHSTLDNAKQKIELLVGVDKNGKPKKKPFDDSATYEPGAGSATDEAGGLDDEEREEIESELEDNDGLF
jgi:exodeoxyribonuclease VII small subunit